MTLLKNLFLITCLIGAVLPLRADDFSGRGDRGAWQRSKQSYEVGMTAKDQKRFASAIHHLSRAIGTYPFDPNYYIARASCYQNGGDYALAEKDARMSVVLSGGQWLNWLVLADNFSLQNKWNDCCRAANAAGAAAASDAQGQRLVSMRLDVWKRQAGAKWRDTRAAMDLSEAGVGLKIPQEAGTESPYPLPAPGLSREDSRSPGARVAARTSTAPQRKAQVEMFISASGDVKRARDLDLRTKPVANVPDRRKLLMIQAAITSGLAEAARENYNAALNQFRRAADAAPGDLISKMNVGVCQYYLGDKKGALSSINLSVGSADFRPLLNKALVEHHSGNRTSALAAARAALKLTNTKEALAACEDVLDMIETGKLPTAVKEVPGPLFGT